MKVLVACEESQRVCIAFRERGHEAYSCDILDCSGGHPEWHIKGDVSPLLKEKWDLIIAHPPCTYLANAGLHYLKSKPDRLAKHTAAVDFFMSIYNASCERVAIENPIGWINTHFRKPDQIIQPYFFGDPEIKTTCLWLRGLSKLIPTNMLNRPEPKGHIIRKSGPKKGQKYNYYWRQGKNAKMRSKTFLGIAKAMAEQWG